MPPRSLSAAASVLVAGLAYACAWAVLPHDGLFINDNGCKLIQTEGLVRNGGWLTCFASPSGSGSGAKGVSRRSCRVGLRRRTVTEWV